MIVKKPSTGNVQILRIFIIIIIVFAFSYLISISLFNNLSALQSFGESKMKKDILIEIKKHNITRKLSKYAVFCANTPNGESYRSYDYAYYLPLTALAWERLGFRSIVLIVGSRCEWENDPALTHILSYLEAINAIIIFIFSRLEYRTTVSQTARVFVVNMIEFPGNDDDYLITSDSDLWPLRLEHFIPRENKNIVLLHSECCGSFKLNNVSYPMYPMSNIGATVSTWREIMNDNHTIANNSESILVYLKDLFGKNVEIPVIFGEDSWYRDQKMVSIRLSEWMAKHGNNTVYRGSDDGFYRIDRSDWEADILAMGNLTHQYDAHLPVKGYLPLQQKLIKPLIDLMYGKDSWESKWCTQYNEVFLSKVRNFLRFDVVN